MSGGVEMEVEGVEGVMVDVVDVEGVEVVTGAKVACMNTSRIGSI